MQCACPAGYRVPTQAELTTLSDLGYATVTGSVVALLPTYKYVTSTKSYPTNVDGGKNEAWMYKTLVMDATAKTVSYKDLSTYFEISTMRTRCILDTTTPPTISMTGVGTADLTVNSQYSLSISGFTTALAFYWDFGGAPKRSLACAIISENHVLRRRCECLGSHCLLQADSARMLYR